MSESTEPYSLAAAQAADAAKARDQQKQLVLDYKQTFNSERGQRVLDDLKAMFGYDKPSGTYGMSHGDVMLREGMKMPLYHIESRLRMTFRAPAKRQKKAIAPTPTEVTP